MALNKTIDKAREIGAIKIYGEHSLGLGEIIFLIIAIVIMAKKGAVNVKNPFNILAIVLILLAFMIW